jgi:hypothetical protein
MFFGTIFFTHASCKLHRLNCNLQRLFKSKWGEILLDNP